MKPEYAAVLDGEKRYVGDDRTRLLKRIAREANSAHEASLGAFRTSLDHARTAGDALRVAKKVLGGRGKWSKWRRDNFAASPETARIYMRISREWDGPRLTAARAEGVTLNTITDVLNVLRGRPADPKPPSAEQSERYRHRAKLKAEVIKNMQAWLKYLDDTELEVLSTAFNPALLAMQRELRELVCMETGEGDLKKENDAAKKSVLARQRARKVSQNRLRT